MSAKIFIYHDGTLGDVLLSLPAIGLIKKNNFLHIAARQDIGILLLNTSFINETSRIDSPFYLSLYLDKLDNPLKEFLSRFFRAYIFSVKTPSVISCRIKEIIPDIVEIKTIPDENVRINVAEFRLIQLADKDRIDLSDNIFTYQYASNLLKIPSSNIEQAIDFLHFRGYNDTKPLIAIHPGSGGEQKCWLLERYFELIDILLKNCNAFVLIFSGYAESDKQKEKINNFINGKRNLLHISDNELITVASFISHCDIYIGNDSGISHLSSMLCKKVIIIFGPTEPFIWKPPYDNVKVVSANCQCAPCNPSKANACYDKKCLNNISVFDVYKEICSFIY